MALIKLSLAQALEGTEVSAAELARLVGVHRSTIHHLVHGDTLPTYLLGKAIDEWAKKHRIRIVWQNGKK